MVCEADYRASVDKPYGNIPTMSATPDPSALDNTSRFHSTFKAFGIANFRWFFTSLFGNFASMNIQMFIRGWLVFEITNSYEKLGWMTAAGGLAGLIAAPLGGVVADRVRQKKHIIQIAGLANMIITLWVAWLIHIEVLGFTHLLITSILQGLVMNIMMPARQALTKDVVGLDLLTNAIALNTSGMNVARLLLPGLAGGMVAALGGGDGNIAPAKWVYLAMSGLYLFNSILIFKVKSCRQSFEHGNAQTFLSRTSIGISVRISDASDANATGIQFSDGVFQPDLLHSLAGLCKRSVEPGSRRSGPTYFPFRHRIAGRLPYSCLPAKQKTS